MARGLPDLTEHRAFIGPSRSPLACREGLITTPGDCNPTARRVPDPRQRETIAPSRLADVGEPNSLGSDAHPLGCRPNRQLASRLADRTATMAEALRCFGQDADEVILGLLAKWRDVPHRATEQVPLQSTRWSTAGLTIPSRSRSCLEGVFG
jgi:hypothetical protein